MVSALTRFASLLTSRAEWPAVITGKFPHSALLTGRAGSIAARQFCITHNWHLVKFAQAVLYENLLQTFSRGGKRRAGRSKEVRGLRLSDSESPGLPLTLFVQPLQMTCPTCTALLSELPRNPVSGCFVITILSATDKSNILALHNSVS